MPFVCQGFTAAQRWRKGNAIVSFPGSDDREQQTLLAGCEITRLC
jgi:ribosomal 30S subunit maturation factor RimM